MKHLRDRWLNAVLNGVLQVFEEYHDVPKFLVPGNHDGTAGGRSGLAALDEMDHVSLFEEPAIRFAPWGDGKVLWWPYQPTLDELPRWVEKARKERATAVLGHAFIQGSAVGPDDVRLGIGTPPAAFGLVGKAQVFSYGFFGDVHRQQRVSVGGAGKRDAQVWVPGSPCAQNWGEREGGKGCLLVDFDAGEVTPIPVQAPQFIVADWTDDRVQINRRLAVCAGTPEVTDEWRGHFVRLLLPPDADPKLVERLREASGARTFQAIVQRTAASAQRVPSLHGGLSAGQLVEEYVRARPPEDLDQKVVVAAGKRLLGER